MAGTSVIRKTLPSASNDGVEVATISDRYGAQLLQPMHGGKRAIAEQGNYFVATNPTPGTGIALTTSITTFAETAGAVGVSVYLRNTETITGNSSKRIYPDYLMLRLITQAPTTASVWYATGVLDYSAVRYTSGGSAITPVNVNGDSSLASIASMYFGALTTAIPATRRLLFNLLLRAQVPIIMDQYTIVFGGIEGGDSLVTAGSVQNLVLNAPPLVIGPSQNLCITLWGTGSAAASQWEFEMGWWEK